jgi:CRP-like cAMP-binding protein
LNEDQARWLSSVFKARRFRKGQVIFGQGDIGDYLYVIASGRVRVFLLNADGREMVLRIYGPNEILGEMAVLDGGERSAGAAALDEVSAFALRRDDFLHLPQDNFALVEHVIAMLVERLRYTTVYTEHLAFLDASKRVAALLLQLASADIASEGPIRVRMTQEELANFAGATREWVNHALRDYAEAGLVQLERGAVVVLDRGGLRQKLLAG